MDAAFGNPFASTLLRIAIRVLIRRARRRAASTRGAGTPARSSGRMLSNATITPSSHAKKVRPSTPRSNREHDPAERGFVAPPQRFVSNQAIKYIRETALEKVMESRSDFIGLTGTGLQRLVQEEDQETPPEPMVQDLVFDIESLSNSYQTVQLFAEIRHIGAFKHHADNDDIAHDKFRKRVSGDVYSIYPRDRISAEMELPRFSLSGPYRIDIFHKSVGPDTESGLVQHAESKIIYILLDGEVLA